MACIYIIILKRRCWPTYDWCWGTSIQLTMYFGKKIYNSIMLLNPKLLRLKSHVLSFFCQKFHLQNLDHVNCVSKKSTRKLQFLGFHMGMGQNLLLSILGGWTSIYQLFWCSPGVQGFDTLPYGSIMVPKFQHASVLRLSHFRSCGGGSDLQRLLEIRWKLVVQWENRWTSI